MDVKEKQGHLGNLSDKSVPQLQELLDRENNILKNIKFIEKLADKGEKIKKLAKQLEAELQSRMEVDSAADLINNMTLRSSGPQTQAETPYEERDVLEKIINRPPEKTILMEKGSSPESSHFINSYEKVIKKAEKKPTPNKFFPHKSLKSQDKMAAVGTDMSKDVVSLDQPPPLESPPSSPRTTNNITNNSQSESETMQVGDSPFTSDPKSKTSDRTAQSKDNEVQNTKSSTSGKSKLKHKYDESLAASNFRPTQFEKAKVISVEESVNLIQAQRERQEKLQAQHAAQKLTERLGVKMCDYEPKQVQMRYRDPVLCHSDASSDSEDGEMDYPD